MTHRVDDALVEALRSATRINAPYDADPSCRIVGFILPQAIAWPESGTAIDIPRVLLSAALEAAGVAELREENERLRAHISEHVAFVEKRIQDGIELGAAVWRIALEDIARENRAALANQGKARRQETGVAG